jgi:glycosyltransferase involved in cell wall biosynthesis
MGDDGGRRPGATDQGGLLLVCSFAARQPGSFLPSQFAVARAAQARLGLRTVFVLPERAGRREWIGQVADAGFRCELLPAKASRRPVALARIARAAGARIVHSHFTWFDLASLYAGRRAGAAVAWHVHNGMAGYPVRQRVTDLLKARLLARGCDAVVGVSDQVGRDMARRGYPRDRIEVIHNGLVLERFAGERTPRAEMRARLGIDPEAFLVLTYGWPPEVKGADLVVEAMSRVPQATVVMVGEPEPLRRALGDRVDELSERLTLIAPVVDVASLLEAADVFVSASRVEGFPYAIVEAMAAGLPVIGPGIPAMEPFLDAPGFLPYPAGDSSALAGRIAEVARTPDRAERGALGREWALEHLGGDRYVDATIDLYRRMLERRGA